VTACWRIPTCSATEAIPTAAFRSRIITRSWMRTGTRASDGWRCWPRSSDLSVSSRPSAQLRTGGRDPSPPAIIVFARWSLSSFFNNSGRGVWVPACAGTTTRIILATHCARGLLETSRPLQTEGAGKTGCLLHPRSRVRIVQKQNAHEHTGSAETLRPSLRNGFTAYIVLSPVSRGSVATVASRILPRRLTPAYGRQDHTTSPYASAPFVIGTATSTASHRTFVTIMIRPSCRVRRTNSWWWFARRGKRNIFNFGAWHKFR